MSFSAVEIILKKKRGLEHSPEEIEWLISSYSKDNIPDYQMSAWMMAICFQGMSIKETAQLTLSMKNSGRSFDFSGLGKPRVDKHSTGGVGDKTSLIIGPIMAAAQVHCPMIAGRGLGHTGGTLDKLESLPGFNVNLTFEKFTELVKEKHFSIMGQTPEICPADKKLYALRDVTGTVDSLPLICGSIMSKKLSEDLTGLVLDIKFGSGAFMKSPEEAEKLAHLLKDTGAANGLKVTALLSNMNEPLGRFSGNSCEIQECIEILQGKSFIFDDKDLYEPTRELSLQLSGHMLYLAEKANSPEEGYSLSKEFLESGKAYNAFMSLCEYQGPTDIDRLPKATHKKTFYSSKKGFLSHINTEKLGYALVELGAGRKKTSDHIDHSAGMEYLCYLNQAVSTQQPLFHVFGNDLNRVNKCLELLENTVEITASKGPNCLPLVLKVIT